MQGLYIFTKNHFILWNFYYCTKQNGKKGKLNETLEKYKRKCNQFESTFLIFIYIEERNLIIIFFTNI